MVGIFIFTMADSKNHITKNITINKQQSIPFIDSWNDKNNSQIDIDNLSRNRTVSFDSVRYGHHHLHLHVKDLSGSLYF
ncbi:hypothetical protein BWD162_003620 [Bartonella sp. WD16.2]|nr:hypothetical protein BWD162_003620 [Bartonella sp. WD16.2]